MRIAALPIPAPDRSHSPDPQAAFCATTAQPRSAIMPTSTTAARGNSIRSSAKSLLRKAAAAASSTSVAANSNSRCSSPDLR
jgi:hypothetical protein